jgi:hypothetical protein
MLDLEVIYLWGGQGDREIYERKGRGNEKAAGGDDKSS